MSRATQQAYEVLLQEAEARAEFWKRQAEIAAASLEGIETCLLIGRYDLAEQEVSKAIREYEERVKAA